MSRVKASKEKWQWVLEQLMGYACLMGIGHIDAPVKAIFDNLDKDGILGKAPDLGKVYSGECEINFIPCSVKGFCSEVLLVFCFAKDNLNERLREMLYSAGVSCRGITRKVLVAVSKWEPQVYEAYREEIERLRDEGMEILFVMVTDRGVARLPV